MTVAKSEFRAGLVDGIADARCALQVRATPQISIFRRGVQAYVRTGANKSKLEDAVRRFYNTDEFALPEKVLYPMHTPPAKPAHV